mmetsp:Transcript_17169/g.15061  ORF Transcript_17169/g.15061 Transcript_17169/m.15061 type:complete len:168 (+) Transcript_17169:284-787(+)|eukprot:CAMPEP_0114592182 /NCGR_PEP_ID=MMETSP0125-20121206/14072_1 /TAXON_ID=485358 ORGANISM="Aristerostoma sp., Strain ATCC 50986" /NCGR_SAMPLE_ID=MMETSP0125 /ASSEMBLY_ACC=CAM_ASM_000245 /LENGTH=167 /DNA_ID=CAMNT_0001790697 /DNA_START=265 /DNA_END=768 /DNA_ORIENTATION=-
MIKENSNLKQGSKKKRVYLITGETGHGKSTTINCLSGKVQAIEAQKGQTTSQTAKCDVFEAKDSGNYCIDTPGWFDTKLDVSNEDICNLIIAKVQEELKGDSQIDAVVVVWSPTASSKFREHLIEQLRVGLGEDVFGSVIFMVNKNSKKWDDEEEGEAALNAMRTVN